MGNEQLLLLDAVPHPSHPDMHMPAAADGAHEVPGRDLLANFSRNSLQGALPRMSGLVWCGLVSFCRSYCAGSVATVGKVML